MKPVNRLQMGMRTRLTSRQKGVTLLEVMVGFVIFTSSLVGVLDYVSGHVYHFHLSATNLQKVNMTYDWSVTYEGSANHHLLRPTADESFDVTIASSRMDTFTRQDEEVLLVRDQYRVGDAMNSLAWTVIRIN